MEKKTSLPMSREWAQSLLERGGKVMKAHRCHSSRQQKACVS